MKDVANFPLLTLLRREENGDGDIRRDFPGGWISDKKNAFNKKERTQVQKSYFNFTKIAQQIPVLRD